ncbi:hypothetical protein CL629_04015 [bacterium]|nr:hypothetical protein [bacterium]|tara:strand:- start:2685 stop:3029 length:345 start_codon:yes stop_codon:yes gene_type:complete
MNLPEVLQKPLLAFTLIAVILYGIGIGVFLISQSSLPDSGLILQIGASKEIKMLGDKGDMAVIPRVGGIVILINILLAQAFFQKERILSILFLIASDIVALLTLITIGFIISLN